MEKLELKRMIRIPEIHICPYCGYWTHNYFEIKHYEGGSGGYRTYECNKCKGEMEE